MSAAAAPSPPPTDPAQPAQPGQQVWILPLESGGFEVRKADIADGRVLIDHDVISTPGGQVARKVFWPQPAAPDPAPQADADTVWVPPFASGGFWARTDAVARQRIVIPYAVQAAEGGHISFQPLKDPGETVPFYPAIDFDAPPPGVSPADPAPFGTRLDTPLRRTADGALKPPWMFAFEDLERTPGWVDRPDSSEGVCACTIDRDSGDSW